MRALLLGITLALLVLAPAASAQQSGSLTVQLLPLGGPVIPGNTTGTLGSITFTVDITAYGALIGIPVAYTVTNQPAWATIVLSPTTDVFEAPPTPPAGASYSVTRMISITVETTHNVTDHDVGIVEITATTQPGMQGGKAFTGKGTLPIRAAVTDCEHDGGEATPSTSSTRGSPPEARPTHADTAPQASPVKVQSASSATPLPTGWLATGAIVTFGAVGAGVGLALRRR